MTKFLRRFGICCAMFILGSLTPSKETVYLVAASETSEEALQSDSGRRAVAALNRYLDSIGKTTEDTSD